MKKLGLKNSLIKSTILLASFAFIFGLAPGTRLMVNAEEGDTGEVIVEETTVATVYDTNNGNTTNYTDAKSAFLAADDSNVITLFENVTIPSGESWKLSSGTSYKTIFIDLNGKTFTNEGELFADGELDLTVNSLENTGVFNNSGKLNVFLSNMTADTFNFTDGTIKRFWCSGGTVNISGGTINEVQFTNSDLADINATISGDAKIAFFLASSNPTSEYKVSLKLKGGYYCENPIAKKNENETHSITLDETKVEEFSSQSDWIDDSENYKWRVLGDNSIKGAKVNAISDQTYTGNPITPKIEVTFGDVTLVEGTDYEVTFSDNVNVGSATVSIIGKGKYNDTTIVKFNIVDENKTPEVKSIAGAEVSCAEQTYNGSALTPELNVKVDGVILNPDTDYDVKFSDNVNAGIAKAIITGKGGYKDSIEYNFNIFRKSVKKLKVSISPSSAKFNGKTQKPKIVVKDGNKTLKANKDYMVTYDNKPINAKTYRITITCLANYSGKKIIKFTIAKADNTIVVKTKQQIIRAAILKNSNQMINPQKAFIVSKAVGDVTYKKTSGNSKITVNSKGKITVKKGLKKGKYKIKVKVTAKGNKNYKKAEKTVTLTIQVK